MLQGTGLAPDSAAFSSSGDLQNRRPMLVVEKTPLSAAPLPAGGALMVGAVAALAGLARRWAAGKARA